MPNAAVQEHFASYDINVPKVVQRYPPIASYDVKRVQEITAYLDRLGVDVKRVVECYPALLSGRVVAYEAVVRLLRANGVDVGRAVNSYPSVLKRRLDTLQRTMDVIAGCGHSAADVVNRDTRFLRRSMADLSFLCELQEQANKPSIGASREMHPKLAFFSSLGLDAKQLLKKLPKALALSLDNLQATVQYLKALGLDVPKVVRGAPNLLGFRLESLQQRVQFFSQNGLDVVRIANSCPEVLYCSVERKLQPLVAFVVEEMGRPKLDLNKAGNIWHYDLEGRLRPRFCYLKSLGRRGPNLVKLGTYSDERFATVLAKTDVQHYYLWRQHNGYAVRRINSSVVAAAA